MVAPPTSSSSSFPVVLDAFELAEAVGREGGFEGPDDEDEREAGFGGGTNRPPAGGCACGPESFFEEGGTTILLAPGGCAEVELWCKGGGKELVRRCSDGDDEAAPGASVISTRTGVS